MSTNETNPGVKAPHTLDDTTITTKRSLGRRVVLRGGAAGAASMVLVGCQLQPAPGGGFQPGLSPGGFRPAQAGGTTDADTGGGADPVGLGRGYCRAYASNTTDADFGNISDPGGNGRGGPSQRRVNITDVDDGGTADPAGSGRGWGRASFSGRTDSDSNSYCRDPINNGRSV
jgi:hypothetical protein